MIQLNTNIKRL